MKPAAESDAERAEPSRPWRDAPPFAPTIKTCPKCAIGNGRPCGPSDHRAYQVFHFASLRNYLPSNKVTTFFGGFFRRGGKNHFWGVLAQNRNSTRPDRVGTRDCGCLPWLRRTPPTVRPPLPTRVPRSPPCSVHKISYSVKHRSGSGSYFRAAFVVHGRRCPLNHSFLDARLFPAKRWVLFAAIVVIMLRMMSGRITRAMMAGTAPSFGG